MPDPAVPCRTSRRSFFGRVAVAAGGVALARQAVHAAETDPPPPGDAFPRQDLALVEQVVGAAHRDLATVERLVAGRPELAKASWDWGYGDWESPLDAASHMGEREIALFILRHGARPTLFSAAMLGQVEVVRQMVLASPGIQATPGAHGIPLLAHARAGGQPAEAVVEYLTEVGGADGPPPAPEPTEDEARRYHGTFRFGAGPRDVFLVEPGRSGQGLSLTRLGGTPRPLTAVEPHVFRPSGAPSVRIRFAMGEEAAVALEIYEPALRIRARRVA